MTGMPHLVEKPAVMRMLEKKFNRTPDGFVARNQAMTRLATLGLPTGWKIPATQLTDNAQMVLNNEVTGTNISHFLKDWLGIGGTPYWKNVPADAVLERLAKGFFLALWLSHIGGAQNKMRRFGIWWACANGDPDYPFFGVQVNEVDDEAVVMFILTPLPPTYSYDDISEWGEVPAGDGWLRVHSHNEGGFFATTNEYVPGASVAELRSIAGSLHEAADEAAVLAETAPKLFGPESSYLRQTADAATQLADRIDTEETDAMEAMSRLPDEGEEIPTVPEDWTPDLGDYDGDPEALLSELRSEHKNLYASLILPRGPQRVPPFT